MENLLADIKKQLEDLNRTSERIESKIDDCQKQINEIKNENANLKAENEQLKSTVAQQNYRIGYLEKEIKRNNLVIQGVTEADDETNIQLKEKMETILRDMGTPITFEAEIQELHRIGIKHANKTRPIFMKMRNYETKVKVMKSTKELKGTQIYITEDFPKHVMEERKVLSKHLKKAREMGHRAFMKYNKLIVNGEEYGVEDIFEESSNEIPEQDATKKGRTISQRSPQSVVSKRTNSMGCLLKN
uniref:L1 transposable element RRM domain-containing protein n=2 Tax=Photinus pyralis TaxID=7054 RepID=A0A1Y1KNT7_PHOPY